MKFHELAEYLEKLENTSKRLEMIDILAELINNLEDKEIKKALYLTSGYLQAPFNSVKFNMAEKMMIRVLAQAYSTNKKQFDESEIEKKYKEQGDMGDTAYQLDKEKAVSEMSINDVHEKLLDIALVEGSGSQEVKINKSAKLLKNLDDLSAKYAVRIILGTTRLGFTETTILEALAKYLGDRKLKPQIEQTFNIHPDIGLIAETVKQKGLKGLNKISIETGIPVLSQKAQRVSGFMDEAIERIGNVWAEYKFDGTRVQLHIDRNKHPKDITNAQNELFGSSGNAFLVKTYTRNLEETTHQYPDIVEAAVNQIDAQSAILDGEAIGYNPETDSFLPFQETIQRKRKHEVKETVKDIPLKYFVFDILYLNGNSLINLTLHERRKKLAEIVKKGDVIEIAEHIEASNLDSLEKYYEKAKESELEGLIAKNPEDAYQAGARSYSWIKLKTADEKRLEDSIDCVVLGYYVGRGERTKFGIGAFLTGIYDEENDSFKTISKIGTGLKEDDWEKLKILADKASVDKKPVNVDMDKIFTPDVFVKPEIVVEIGADEISKSPTHTAGYALRFPRLIKFRTDKPAYEATTLEEIKEMYRMQRKPTK